jgi:hypothetical protein
MFMTSVLILKRNGIKDMLEMERGEWKPMLNVQHYLDTQSGELNLLPPESKKHWEEVTSRLQSVGAI